MSKLFWLQQTARRNFLVLVLSTASHSMNVEEVESLFGELVKAYMPLQDRQALVALLAVDS